MNKTQRIIIVLLVLAILFSAGSIFISLSAINLDLPQGVSGKVTASSGSGGVNLYVESPPTLGGSET